MNEFKSTSQKVSQKILEVSRIVNKVEKNGVNAAQGFKYQAWEDVVPAVRNACIDAGLLIIPSTKSINRFEYQGKTKDGKDITKYRVEVVCTFALIDVESGEAISAEWIGESESNDDKSVQKALTSATKYYYLKTFLIPVIGEPDNDGETNGEVVKPAPTNAPTTSKTQPVIDWRKRAEEICGDRYSEFVGIAKENKLNLGKILERVWETNGERTTIVEFEESIHEAIKEGTKK